MLTVWIILAIAAGISVILIGGASAYAIIQVGNSPVVTTGIPAITYCIAGAVLLIGLGFFARLAYKAWRRKRGRK